MAPLLLKENFPVTMAEIAGLGIGSQFHLLHPLVRALGA